MQNAKTRLSRLEEVMNPQGAGLFIVVKAGPDQAELDRVLTENGIDRNNPNIDIVILRTLYEGEHGGLADRQPKAELLYINGRK